MPKWKRLLNEAAHAAKAAREIAEKADREGREMSGDEKAEFDRHFAVATQKKAEADAAKADQDVINQAKALADELGMPGAGDDLQQQVDGDGGQRVKGRVKSLGLQVVESAAFQAAIDAFPGGRVPEKARFQTSPISIKNALLTGASDTSGGAFVVPEQTGIVEMLGRRPLAIRNVISVRRTGSDAVEYVRQTSHTNAAAPVPEATTSAAPTAPGTAGALVNAAGGGYKPEGSWAFERDSATVKTIAEWVPVTKRALADVASLEGLINDELRADLAEAEEDQIVSGNGSGENLTGILNTSGTQSQAFSSDIFETVRKALTKVRIVGRAVPNGIGMNPADIETVDLAQDANQQYYGLGPFAMGPRTLWGVPIVESEAIPAGTAVVADWRKAVLWDREQATVTMTDSHADFFIRNLVAILAEQREAFAVVRPSAFVLADLTA